MSEQHAVLSLEGVRVVAGRRAILNVDQFRVEAGGMVALLGPNGSGKSTLLRTAALLLTPVSGRVRIFGIDGSMRTRRTELQRRTASVFTDPTLLDMSVRANVEVALRIRGMPKAERRRHADAWLERLGVFHLAGMRPHTLSAGEAQRVALARAFATEPELLLLDEPFATLDFDTRATLVGELRELLASAGGTAIIATHDRSEAELLADEVAILMDGRLVQEGALSDVFEHPASEDVARLLGHTVIGCEQVVKLLPQLVPRGRTACIPPGAMQLACAGNEDAVALRLLTVRGAGGRVQAVCDAGTPVVFELSMRDAPALKARIGELVHFVLDGSRVYWLA